MTPAPPPRDTPGNPLGEAFLRPVRGHHAFEACVEHLATTIRLGVYPRGAPLPTERDLADRLGVSRTTVRQAIAALREAGMVETTRGRGGGTVVSHRSHQLGVAAPPVANLLDSLDFRRIVEPGAAALAATRDLDEETRRLLSGSLAEITAAADDASHRQCDSRLHLAIATATGSALTIRAVTEVQSDLNAMLQAIPVLRVNIAHSTHQHEQIVAAILAGEPGRAARVMTAHCDDTAALLRGLLDPDDPPDHQSSDNQSDHEGDR